MAVPNSQGVDHGEITALDSARIVRFSEEPIGWFSYWQEAEWYTRKEFDAWMEAQPGGRWLEKQDNRHDPLSGATKRTEMLACEVNDHVSACSAKLHKGDRINETGYGPGYWLWDTGAGVNIVDKACLLYTSPSPRDGLLSRMPSSA